MKRQRIAGEVSTLWARKGSGMGMDDHFWTIYAYVYIYIYVGLWAIYTYVALLIGANNCEDSCVCFANNNCVGDIHIVAFTIIDPE